MNKTLINVILKIKQLGEAIMLDCPETCQVQYKDLDTFKGRTNWRTIYFTSRGSYNWSHDQDPANLLPYVKEHCS